MRKIIVLSMITLDGIMQAPGGPEEDTSGGFEYGGWVAPYFDEVGMSALKKQLKPADLLLGRKTFDIFEGYWPTHEQYWPGVNDVTKYVLSKTKKRSDWQHCVFLENVADIEKLKNSQGGDIQVHGSGELVQQLFKHDLVDELWLKIYPLTLGKGKKFFGDGVIPAAFALTETTITPTGVIMANYKRAGKVKTSDIDELEEKMKKAE
ncbi:dihydrofolate reductase family protein [Taibaiella soli]|uniref:Dihydrofolate reductase n=1 Tax=Taibaiella soli TaxID=1649169 RepID=A0A2W2B2J8_9BACT|nr:dihydrofolate reductase family protein [Taibaiella soli]PZF74258.1 dihydrofolate reductase [Taibaiella soli]